MAFLIETQDESSWFDWNMWMVHSIRSTMYGYLQRKNQQHTHFSLIYVTKVRRLPEYMWIRINSKKERKKNKTQNGLQCETIHFCFMNFIMSIVLMWIAIPLPVANWWCDIQEETNEKKNSKKTPMIETLISNFECDCFGFQ